jgi:hypothetical protein
VVLPSNLFLTNRSSEISSIQFDAADGLGYRTIQYNTPVSLNYADTGWKRWIFKITMTSGQQLFSHSKVHFSNTSNAAGSSGAAARGVADRRATITATEQFNGAFGVADIVISYRNANDQVLRRPLIVAEGFDPGWITSPEEPEGENTFDGFIRTVRNSGSNQLINQIGDFLNPNAPSQYDLVYVNWRNGTDWLQRNALALEEVIRWVNREKQPDLNTGLINPNVVLGSSMGGVIARMALGRMDRRQGPFNQTGTTGFNVHQTNLYVSLDAPHQGANVPLGYQAAARHGLRVYLNIGPAIGAVEAIQFISGGPSPLLSLLLADQPAARQMLANRIDFNYNLSNVTHQQFMQQLRTQWAYPLNIRCIAISNGSECAIDQEFTPGSSLLYHYRSTKTRFITDLMTMFVGVGLQLLNVNPIITTPLIVPGSNKIELTLDIKTVANGGGNAVYYGNIKYTKKILWLVPASVTIADKTYNAPTGMLPVDTYPGGFYTVEMNNLPGAVSQDWMFSYNNSFFIQRRFSFIPTTSALDIGQGNTPLTNANYLARYVGATPPVVPFNTPFANFATAFMATPITLARFNPNTNELIYQFTSTGCEPHEGLYIRSANWLADEMNGNTLVRTNCEGFCTNGVITGPAIICNAETFTAPAGNGVTYDWTCSNPAAVTFTGTGNTRLITRNTSGQVTITVTMTGVCGTTTLSRSVRLGTFARSEYTIFSWPSRVVYGQTVQFGPGSWQVVDATSYNWIWPSGGWTYISGQGTRVLTLRAPAYSPFQTGGDVGLSVGNPCGTSSHFPLTRFNYFTTFRIAASPNPVKDNLNISFLEQTDTAVAAKKQVLELKPVRAIKSSGRTIVTLFEFSTNMQVRQWKQNEIDSKLYNFNVTGLRKGLYILQVDRNNQTAITKIIVE